MSDNCYKANLIDAQYEAFLQKWEEEAREIEIINRIFAQRWADEDAAREEEKDAEEIEALMDLLEEIDQADARIIPECSFDESWIDVCDADTVSNINCGDWS